MPNVHSLRLFTWTTHLHNDFFAVFKFLWLHGVGDFLTLELFQCLTGSIIVIIVSQKQNQTFSKWTVSINCSYVRRFFAFALTMIRVYVYERVNCWTKGRIRNEPVGPRPRAYRHRQTWPLPHVVRCTLMPTHRKRRHCRRRRPFCLRHLCSIRVLIIRVWEEDANLDDVVDAVLNDVEVVTIIALGNDFLVWLDWILKHCI